MAHPLLPTLKEQNRIAITKRGVWESDSQKTLKNLAEDLKVASDKYSSISSIPDLWARPMLYEMILFDKNHPLHDKVVGEWRGLIAIIALRTIRNFNELKVKEIIIPESTASILKDSPVFMQVLAKMIPDELKNIKDDTLKPGELAKLYVITYQNRTIAITWPNTLLVASASLKGNLASKIPWLDGNGLRDPIACFNDKEKCMLVDWLNMILDFLPVDLSSLWQLIVDFRNDIRAVGNKDTKFGTGFNMTGRFALIDRPIEVGVNADTFIKSSHVRLLSLGDRIEKKKKEILIISNEIAKQWNKAESDILVAGHVAMGAVVPRLTGVLLSHNKLLDVDLDNYGAEVRMADEFFTKHLCLINWGNAFPNSIKNYGLKYKGEDKSAILPISEDLLKYLPPNEIVQRTKISVGENNIIEVTLDLPLSGDIDAGKSFIVSKKYDPNKNEIIIYADPPILELWPNFKLTGANKWNRYYSYYSDFAQDTFYAKPCWGDAAVTVNPMKPGGYRQEIVKGDIFPEAYACYGTINVATGKNEVSLGVILVSEPIEYNITQTTMNNCKIGVDFGTTNTTAYLYSNNKTEPIKFENRMISVAGDQEARKGELRRAFLSVEGQPSQDTTSFMSIFHEYVFGSSTERTRPFFGGHIYYLDTCDSINDSGVPRDSVHMDMKWGNASQNTFLQGFLAQLCLQCLAEAAAVKATKIEWKYSYPKAFSPMEKTVYDNTWKTLQNRMKDITDISFTNGTSIDMSESCAMAQYFDNAMGATINSGIVCLDIGGGSTDIAIWQGVEKKIRYQSSLRFAGHDILHKNLWKRVGLLRSLQIADEEFERQLSALEETADYNFFSLQLDALLKYKEKVIFENLALNGFTNNEIRNLLRNIVFSISGIFFYCGLVIGYLQEKNQYDEMEQMPNFYLGGNGSKLLTWAGCGTYDEKHKVNKVFKHAFMTGLKQTNPGNNFEDEMSILKTEKPKEEVAYGLVCNESLSDKKALDILLAGENYLVDGKVADKLDITAEDIQKVASVDKKFPVFQEFIKQFNDDIYDLGLEEITLESRDFTNINKNVNQLLADLSQQKQARDIVVEPVFILIMKEVLKKIG